MSLIRHKHSLALTVTALLAVGTVGLAQTATPVATPTTTAQSVQVVRTSTVRLPFDAPAQAEQVLISQQLPAGATYVAGSTMLDGKALPDPVQGPNGTLYWKLTPVTLENGMRGVLSYSVAHTEVLGDLPLPALRVSFPKERSEVLSGTFDKADYLQAKSLGAAATAQENPGALKLPLAGSLIAVRDRVNVVVEVPTGERPTLKVGGKDIGPDWIGNIEGVPGAATERLTYVGVPVALGSNTITYKDQSLSFTRVGAPEVVEVTPKQLIADGITPLRVHLRTLDANGNPTASGTVTVRSNLEAYVKDGNPNEAGYQVVMQEGEGDLILQPQATPTILHLDVLVDSKVQRYTYEVRPDQHTVGVGMVSATIGLNGNYSLQDNLTWQARASYEAPLAGGKLYLAADKDGLPTDRDTLKRYNTYGDSSIASVPLQGIDPVAAIYDHPSFRVQYRQTALPVDVLPLGENITALSGYSKSNPQVAGFVAMVPKDRITNEAVFPEGTRILRLQNGGISAGSETLQLVTVDPKTGTELRRTLLMRNVDYQLDLSTGIVTLNRALSEFDDGLNGQYVLASYRLAAPMSNRGLAYGAQVKYQGSNYSVGAAAVSLDSKTTFGVRGTYDQGNLHADARAAYASGLMVNAYAYSTSDKTTFSARLRYQDVNYNGVGSEVAGTYANLTYDTQVTDRLRAVAEGEYHSYPVVNNGVNSTTSGGAITARAEYDIKPFSVGAGLKYNFGDTYGLSAVVSGGYHQDPLDVEVVHAQPFSGTVKPETKFSARYRVNNNVTVGLIDTYTWGEGSVATLTMDSRLGNVNYAVAYDLPTAGGQGNRARFGVSTTLPLNRYLTAGVHASALYVVNNTAANEVVVGGDLNYLTDKLTATAGTDLVYRSSSFGVVLRAGATGEINDRLSVSGDGLVEYGAGRNGQRFSVGYAYRGHTIVSLGTVRYLNGTLTNGVVAPELSSNFSVEYRQPAWAIRGGVDTRTLLDDRDSFTWQANLGGNVYLADRFSVGGWWYYLAQPATKQSQSGFGLEAGIRALPGTWLTAGYNFQGFDGIGNLYTRPGAYLRLDVVLDEQSWVNKK